MGGGGGGGGGGAATEGEILFGSLLLGGSPVGWRIQFNRLI